jgi:nicotinamidase-related amidase
MMPSDSVRPLSLGSTALLIIDAQRALFQSTPPPWKGSEIISHINKCAEAARAASVPVILVQHDGTEAEGVAPGAEGWMFHLELKTAPTDVIVRKTTCDAFYETSLESELRRRGIRQLVITGFATEFCIEATVRSAVSKDYRVTVVSDAHTTHDSEVLPAKDIIRHHNHTWPACASKHPIEIRRADEIAFK